VVVEKITFLSPKPDLEVVIRPGRIYLDREGNRIVDEGISRKFVRGRLEIGVDEVEVLTGMRKSMLYGAEIFEQKAQEFTPPADPEKDAMAKRIAELEAALNAQSTPEQSEPSPGLNRFQAAKAKAESLGIKGERAWKTEDYEKAIEQVGAQ
jgi:hypothetical protein